MTALTDTRLARLPDAVLERPSLWGKQQIDVRMRLHQIAVHLTETAIQMEKIVGSGGELRAIVGADGVLDRYEDLLVYEYDAYMDRSLPQVVVRPTSGEQVAAVVKLAAREQHVNHVQVRRTLARAERLPENGRSGSMERRAEGPLRQ